MEYPLIKTTISSKTMQQPNDERKRSMSLLKHTLFDVFVIIAIASGFVQLYYSRYASLGGEDLTDRIHQERLIKMQGEKRRIYELEEKLYRANKLHAELAKLNIKMSKHLTELENKLKEKENTKVKIMSKENVFPAQRSEESPNNGPKIQREHKFKVGEIVEVKRDILSPSIVVRQLPNGEYDVMTTDGYKLNSINQNDLQSYVPYEKGMVAFCHIGEFAPGDGEFAPCDIIQYMPGASEEGGILQGQYQVHIHAMNDKHEYDTTLPVWKIR